MSDLLTMEKVHVEVHPGQLGIGLSLLDLVIGTGTATRPSLVAVCNGPEGRTELIAEPFIKSSFAPFEFLQSVDLEQGMEALERLSARLDVWGFDPAEPGEYWYSRRFWRPYLPVDRLLHDRAFMSLLDAYLASRPNNSHALAIRAFCHKVLGEYGLALRASTAALEIRPTNAMALTVSAEALYADGQPELAEERARRASELDPCDDYPKAVLTTIREGRPLWGAAKAAAAEGVITMPPTDDKSEGRPMSRIYLEFLADLNMAPNIDAEGDIAFFAQGLPCYVQVDESQPLFFRLVSAMMPAPTDPGDAEAAQAICNVINGRCKVVKACVTPQAVEVAVESFYAERHQFQSTFAQNLTALQFASIEYLKLWELRPR